jgi:transposase-like protein
MGTGHFVPKLLVTDKLHSYASAFRQLQLTCLHEQGLRKNIAPRIRDCCGGDP